MIRRNLAKQKPRRPTFILLSLLLGLAAGTLVGELALRLSGWQSRVTLLSRESFQLSPNPRLRYELRPGAPDWEEPVSSAGLRDREFSIDKPVGVFRIAVVGDSVTFGFGLRREQAYPKVLERVLNQGQGPWHFEVLNFGVSGYNIEQIVETSRQKVLPFSPDLILYGYCLNDPQDFSLELRALESRLSQREESLEEAHLIGARRWLRHSRLFRLVFQFFYTPPSLPAPAEVDIQKLSGFQGSPSQYLAWIHDQTPSWRRLVEGFRELSSLGKEAKTKIVVAILPTQTVRARGGYPLSEVHHRVLSEARAQGLDAIDLAPSFQSVLPEERLFQDYLHFESSGNLLAALGVLQGLLDLELLPTPLETFDDWPRRDELERKFATAITRSQD